MRDVVPPSPRVAASESSPFRIDGRKEMREAARSRIQKTRTPAFQKLQQQLAKAPTAAGSTAALKSKASSSRLTSANSLLRQSKLGQPNARESLLNYVKCIMYTFGDVQEPLDTAAVAVTDALLTQMQLAYRTALDARQQKGHEGSTIQICDVVFAYRHDVALLYRVYKRLFTRLEAKKALGDTRLNDSGAKVTQELKESFERLAKDEWEKVSAANYVDTLNQERLVRMDERTQNMQQAEYLYFHKARSISFVSSAAARRIFMQWVSRNISADIGSRATELLAVIAYEVVAKITETAKRIRQNTKANQPAPKFCKPKLRNPVLHDGDELIPQSQLRHAGQYGLQRDDIRKAVEQLVNDAKSPTSDRSERGDRAVSVCLF